MDVITEYAWIAWLVLILVFVIIEVLSLEFTFLMLAVGSVVGLLSGLIGVPWWGQLLIAAAASVLLLLAVRPALLRALQKGADPAKSNVDALLGQHGIVVSTVSRHDGQVKLSNGETWTARIAQDSLEAPLEPGTPIVLTIVDGATAIVVPVPTRPQLPDEQKEQS
ncbi:MAG TPA: NfeD family protein [Plantibacter sp.]|uniref:NfeD family protein n=1 Tax=unclassified Plantibacter TaxID=2624265 RepID=UPI002C7F2767|nr:NfeD family protein [Plantibacter sp.]